MPNKYWTGKSGRIGTIPGTAVSAPLTATASSTASFAAPFPYGGAYIETLTYVAGQAAAGGGAITLAVKKVRGGTATTLATGFDITSGTVGSGGGAYQIPFAAGLSGGQRTLQPGDRIEIVLTAASTVTTQPGGTAASPLTANGTAHVVVDLSRIS
jgi:hypothetical protein